MYPQNGNYYLLLPSSIKYPTLPMYPSFFPIIHSFELFHFHRLASLGVNDAAKDEDDEVSSLNMMMEMKIMNRRKRRKKERRCIKFIQFSLWARYSARSFTSITFHSHAFRVGCYYYHYPQSPNKEMEA